MDGPRDLHALCEPRIAKSIAAKAGARKAKEAER
jgi:hypothetical protein